MTDYRLERLAMGEFDVQDTLPYQGR